MRNNQTKILEIDGTFGEGGGQILRSSLSLSALTGRPFHISNIRGGRKKGGLLRQHLTCVQAAAQISSAKVTGAELKSRELTFEPGLIEAGTYEFNIASAGSCLLVFQTVLPILMNLDKPSTIILRGGTHNPMAPPACFLERSFLPILRRMGVEVDMKLYKAGFYPAGGGHIEFKIYPGEQLKPLKLDERGASLKKSYEVEQANLPFQIARREIDTLHEVLGWGAKHQKLIKILDSPGPGNLVILTHQFENVSSSFCSFGTQGVAAEKVSKTAIKAYHAYLKSEAVVDEYLADQLILPMALARNSSFIAHNLSLHATTNLEITRKFLDTKIHQEDLEGSRTRVSFL